MSRARWFQSSALLAMPVIGAILATSPAFAADPATPAPATSGPYISLGGGVNFENALTATESPLIGNPGSHSWHYNDGESGVFGIGWAFGTGLRLEVDTNYLNNQQNSVSGYGPGFRAGGLEQKVGGLVEALYDIHLGLPVTPYVGVGVGADAVNHNHWNFGPKSSSLPQGYYPESETGGDFAYTGIVGLSYPVSWVPGLSMTAEYRFLGLADPQPRIPYLTYPSGSTTPVGGGNIRLTGDYNQSIMVGLRFELFAPHGLTPGPDAASGAVIESPPPVTQAPVHTYLVFFDWDRADLTTRARQIVAEAAQASTQVQTTRIDVNGYTDASGGAAYNKRLSLRRAETVQAELVRDGVPQDEIAIQGFGEANPLIATAKGVREPQNRRVEIILH